eukprot:Opistho-2@69409
MAFDSGGNQRTNVFPIAELSRVTWRCLTSAPVSGADAGALTSPVVAACLRCLDANVAACYSLSDAILGEDTSSVGGGTPAPAPAPSVSRLWVFAMRDADEKGIAGALSGIEDLKEHSAGAFVSISDATLPWFQLSRAVYNLIQRVFALRGYVRFGDHFVSTPTDDRSASVHTAIPSVSVSLSVHGSTLCMRCRPRGFGGRPVRPRDLARASAAVRDGRVDQSVPVFVAPASNVGYLTGRSVALAESFDADDMRDSVVGEWRYEPTQTTSACRASYRALSSVHPRLAMAKRGFALEVVVENVRLLIPSEFVLVSSFGGEGGVWSRGAVERLIARSMVAPFNTEEQPRKTEGAGDSVVPAPSLWDMRDLIERSLLDARIVTPPRPPTPPAPQPLQQPQSHAPTEGHNGPISGDVTLPPAKATATPVPDEADVASVGVGVGVGARETALSSPDIESLLSPRKRGSEAGV